MKKIVILGGGITGLSTAWKLSENTNNSIEVLEIQDQLGGISSTFQHKEYSLDYGPHKIYTQMPEILSIIKKLIGNDLLTIPKKSRIRLKGKYFDYPIGLKNVLFGMSPLTSFKCVLDAGKTTMSNLIKKKEDVTYEDYIVNRFGKGLYQLVFEPYAKKVWGNPKELSAELARTRVAIPSVFVMLKNMIVGNKNKPQISADHFYYPKKGIIMLSEALAKKIETNNGKIRRKVNTKKIEIKDNKVDKLVYEEDSKKFEVRIDLLVSTIPIEKLITLIHPAPSSYVTKAASALKYKPIILLYVVVNKPRLFNDNWIFFPETEFVFNRVSEQKGFSESMMPKDKTVLTVEITCDAESELYKASKEDIFKRAIGGLEKAELLKESDVLDYFVVKLRNIYPIYDLKFKENINVVLKYLKSIENLYTNGRQGLFNYNNMDHCIDMGFTLAEHIKDDGTKEGWEGKNKKFEDYRIVD